MSRPHSCGWGGRRMDREAPHQVLLTQLASHRRQVLTQSASHWKKRFWDPAYSSCHRASTRTLEAHVSACLQHEGLPQARVQSGCCLYTSNSFMFTPGASRPVLAAGGVCDVCQGLHCLALQPHVRRNSACCDLNKLIKSDHLWNNNLCNHVSAVQPVEVLVAQALIQMS
jgi:hypothetical protein